MKLKVHSRVVGTAVVFILMYALLYILCRYRLALIESQETMYYDTYFIGKLINQPGGVTKLISLQIVQFFGNTTLASIITAALLTFITYLCSDILSKIGSSRWISPIAIAPAVATVVALCDIYFMYYGIVAIALALTLLCLIIRIKSYYIRLTTYATASIALLYAAGAVSMLFAIIAVLVEITNGIKRGWSCLICPILVYLIAYILLRMGYYSNMAHALLPESYYTPWLHGALAIDIPWIALIGIIILGTLSRYVTIKSKKASVIMTSLISVIVIVFGWWDITKYNNIDDEAYAELMLYICRQDWNSVTERCHTLDMNQMRLQNCLNLALAEKGILAKSLFQQPCAGTQSLIDTSLKSPINFMLMSDIYYWMGHISLAQKLAFEANEGMGDYSPRLLKRLADVNIITGQYDVARRYINILSTTIKYKSWADERRKLLASQDLSSNPELREKRQCLFSTNNFAGINGIEGDLTNVLRSNPKHQSTSQYLGCMLLLSHNVPAFVEYVNEFYGTEALPTPLPKHYQEAIAVASLASDPQLSARFGVHPTVIEQCKNFWSKRQAYPHTFWQYLRNGNSPHQAQQQGYTPHRDKCNDRQQA